MIIWKQLRLPLLLFTFSSVLLVLIRVILLPISDKTAVSSFVFPEQVPLPQWQLSTSRSLPKPKKLHTELITQQHYQYLHKNLPLDIEMRYMTEGNVPLFIKEFTSISSSANVRRREGVGYYGIGVDKQRAYLSACINPYGSSTFTEEQFNQNRLLYETHPQQILSWILGQKKQFQERRCLWAHLSVPLKDSSLEVAYQKLENVWFSWYQWWLPRFPKS